MTRARLGALLTAIVLVALFVVALAVTRSGEPLPPRPPAQRPTLLLLTSLPLVFGEGFSLSGGGSPALTALRSRYRVEPISVSSPEELARGRLLLMAQPQAEPPEELVALDDWVRRGGRLLLLADPMLEWPSERPLGDRLRPPVMFTDTGLLAHWGLRLDAPDQRGPAIRLLGRESVATVSPGTLHGGCQISEDRLVARCRIGKGEAVIVADADLLDVAELGSAGNRNLDALLRALSELEPEGKA
jgi:hypothetical protein